MTDPLKKPAIPRASVTKNLENKPQVQFGGIDLARQTIFDMAKRTSTSTASPPASPPITARQQIELQNKQIAAQKRASILNDLGDFKSMFGATQKQISSEKDRKEIHFPVGKVMAAVQMRNMGGATATTNNQTTTTRAASNSKVNGNANVTHDDRASSNNLIESDYTMSAEGSDFSNEGQSPRRHTMPNSLTKKERNQAEILERNERVKSLIGSYNLTHARTHWYTLSFFGIQIQSISSNFLSKNFPFCNFVAKTVPSFND